ncbi:MAG TPA: Wzz/FepE/Etk N-terminal domain-containing protein [Steroidobacteraceae bacterium]|jgi:uncharacterized protein involved in exopolysaccharide biosynthesis
MNDNLVGHADGGEIGFQELFADAWTARWAVLSITFVFTISGIIAGLLIPKQYRAEILLAATDSSTGASGGLGALASQYGALASLAGISISGKDTKAESIAVLQSRLITESYVRDNDLLPVFYSNLWDEKAKNWKSTDVRKIPSLWLANQYFSKQVREVKEDKPSGLVTMRITWRDPIAAAKWANDLVRNTNRYLRDKAIRESDQNIAYLNDQAAKTSVIEAREAIYSILKQELNKQMIARGREEYALKVLDPAQPPERPSSPSAPFLGAMGFGVGIIISALWVWRRSSVTRGNPA